MAWTRIDDKFLLNPKVQTVGVYGMALYLSGLIYCNGNLTDGFILEGVLPMLCGMAYQTPAKRIADKLVEVNLWEIVEGGYQIHDFLTFNKSKKEIEAMNKTRANNGAKGGRLPKLNETDLLSKQVSKQDSKQDSKQPPIIPNPLSLNLKDKTVVVGDSARGEIFKVYENEIGVLTPYIADNLQAAEKDYPEGWVIEAIHEASANGGKTWKYVSAILQNWQQHGFKAPRPKQARYQKPAVNQGLEAVKALAGEDGIVLDGIFSEVENGR